MHGDGAPYCSSPERVCARIVAHASWSHVTHWPHLQPLMSTRLHAGCALGLALRVHPPALHKHAAEPVGGVRVLQGWQTLDMHHCPCSHPRAGHGHGLKGHHAFKHSGKHAVAAYRILHCVAILGAHTGGGKDPCGLNLQTPPLLLADCACTHAHKCSTAVA